MGGSGGYGIGYAPIGDIGRLQNIARKELRKPAPEPRKRIFLSFRSDDLDRVNLFRGQAKNKNSDFDFIDYSLRIPFNSENAEYIRRGIRERIKNSSVTVVLVGDTTHGSQWVDWEIRESIKQGKGVVAVSLRESLFQRLPKALTEYGIKPVPWDHKKIRDAINEAHENR